MAILDLGFDTVTAVNRYGFYCIPAQFKGREVSKLLLKGQVNEPRTLELIRARARDGDVISGGAFVGDFLPAIAQALAGGARLHSFEPNPPSFQATQATLALNRLENVDLHPVAVGAEKGVLPLQVTGKGGNALGGKSSIVADHEEGRTIEVPVATLDDLVPAKRKVSVLHLDVEGFEMPAVMGAARIIRDNAPVLVLEVVGPNRRSEYLDQLRAAFPQQDYRLIGAMERNAFYVATA